MPLSMTGFGAAETDDGQVRIEVKSVNHRYLDVRWNIPPELQSVVPALERQVRSVLSRGRIDVRIELRKDADPGPAEIDEAAARSWLAAARRLADLGAEWDLGVSSLLSLPGVVREGRAHGGLGSWEAEMLEGPLGGALEQLVRMRRDEGENTGRELRRRLAGVEVAGRQLKALSSQGVQGRMDRLRSRLAELVESGLEPQRLHQEAALLADRVDVREELERLDSHRAQFETLLDSEGPVGRRLDFLLQEMNREITTVGSKLPEATEVVVDVKAELERMREQVQNVE